MGRVIGSVIPSVVYTHTAAISASTATFTFNSVAISTESAYRYVVVGMSFIGNVFTGISFNGSAMTNIGSPATGMYIAPAPTGTTGTVVITQTPSGAGIATIMVWAVYHINSPTQHAFVTSTATPAALSLNVPARGVVIAVAYPNLNGATCTWAGVTGDVSQTSSINNIVRGGASAAATTAGTPRVVTCTYSGSGAFRGASAASWR